jgi:hypothetical protein
LEAQAIYIFIDVYGPNPLPAPDLVHPLDVAVELEGVADLLVGEEVDAERRQQVGVVLVLVDVVLKSCRVVRIFLHTTGYVRTNSFGIIPEEEKNEVFIASVRKAHRGRLLRSDLEGDLLDVRIPALPVRVEDSAHAFATSGVALNHVAAFFDLQLQGL